MIIEVIKCLHVFLSILACCWPTWASACMFWADKAWGKGCSQQNDLSAKWLTLFYAWSQVLYGIQHSSQKRLPSLVIWIKLYHKCHFYHSVPRFLGLLPWHCSGLFFFFPFKLAWGSVPMWPGWLMTPLQWPTSQSMVNGFTAAGALGTLPTSFILFPLFFALFQREVCTLLLAFAGIKSYSRVLMSAATS